MEIIALAYSPFQVNTYILYDKTKECVIIDPACFFPEEEEHIEKIIKSKKLKPKMVLSTHCHLDHVFGNDFICNTFNIETFAHKEEQKVLESASIAAKKYGLEMRQPQDIQNFIKEGDLIEFGNTKLEVLHVPGHTKGSLVYVNKAENDAFVGDVLFNDSIGRTDLPGGDFDTLIYNIKTKLYTLNPETKVYPGHGAYTSIEKEGKTNPFVIF